MVNIGYRVARRQGQTIRSFYSAALPWIVSRPIPQTREIDVEVYSLSCDRDLPEQVASIRSFIRYVGIPKRFIVVSDGSYSSNSCKLLWQIHPCVEIVDIKSLFKDNLPKCVLDYANNSPMGKKLVVEMSLTVEQATIYVDSDVLFFPGSEVIVALSQSNKAKAYYLPDCASAFDERIFSHESEKSHPVNGGFMLLKEPLNWNVALERLAQLKDAPNYFTEQTMLHLSMHQSQAATLCDRKFILRLDDQFIYPDLYANSTIALRHYVNPVRHKLWMKVMI
jgi:hypothetical protein